MPERDYQTLVDVMNQTNNGQLIHIGQEFTHELTFGEECPYTEATDLTRDIGIFETPYKFRELTSLTDLDSPVKSKKAGYYKREDIMGMQEAWCEFNKKTYDSYPNSSQLYTRMINRMLRNMGWDWEFMCLNGSISNDPRGFNGLLPRMAHLTDLDRKGIKDPSLSYPLPCIDAGMETKDVDGELCSMLFVFFDQDEGVTQIYPRGTGQKGIKFEKYPFQRIKTDEGNIVQSAATSTLTGGIAVKNALSAIRIANINYKDLEGMKNLQHAMYDAMEYFKSSQQASVKIYTNARVITALRKYRSDLVSPATYADATPKNSYGDINFDIFTIRRCDSMLATEGLIA